MDGESLVGSEFMLVVSGLPGLGYVLKVLVCGDFILAFR